MARAACLMKSGSVIHSDPPTWQRLVHRDIKPANILISHAPLPPTDAWWPSLPLVKLGDFGMMVREDIKGYKNPSKQINMGTELYCAPERVNSLEDIEDEGTPTPLKFQLPGPEEYLSENRDLYELLSR
ncbi:hypothetical protein KC352_g9864 [Hortaea werneckii]|nr:hypothetical protein KC352_g9864 [Hortaea werneckii]